MELFEIKKTTNLFKEKLDKNNLTLSYIGIFCSIIISVYISTIITGHHVFPLLYINNIFLIPLILFISSVLLNQLQCLYDYLIWGILLKLILKKTIKQSTNTENVRADQKVPYFLMKASNVIFFYPKIILNIIGFVLMLSSLYQNIKIFNYI
jgi:hypothetical protein